MKLFKCLIVDDEPLARKGMAEFIEKHPDLECVGQAKNAIEASKFLSSEPVDILFLDIEMPRVSGLELLESRVADPAVVITSAYDHYAIKGFELDVQDYLLKPFAYDRFVHGVEKAISFLNTRKTEEKGIKQEVVYIRSEGVLHKVAIKDLLFVEGMQNYMICQTNQGRLIAHITMKALQDQLPEELFVRTHKSYLVNASCIDRIEGNEAIIGGFRIPLSRNYKEEAVGKIIGDQLLNRQ
ncbi:MAG: response regulator [Bacteroidota bacterium]|nr:response regulator [Bacteroidota bacterium]MDX5430240.1 response regulator [Bacteroidota bacterium]MDX5469001.1 response regulator [Bacteroidota bacterium]